jgi:hydroxypyruvate isomerase
VKITRRQALHVAGLAGISAAAVTSPARAQAPRDAVDPSFRIRNNRIKQSVMGWCFKSDPNPMSAVELAKACKSIGIPAIEGISAKDYSAVRELGLEISLVSSHGFAKGPVDPNNHSEVVHKLRESIDLAVAVKCPSVITFTGMRKDGISDDQSKKNCVDIWKQVIGYAEKNNINLVLEHLNSRDDSHPMKGHPGYFGDDVDLCVELINQVGSKNMKLLFDIYHVQIMNGDVIRRIRQYKDVIGHYHTAGNPGRQELDDEQEINYPPIMRAILKTGYTGYVAQEFIPTWEDKVQALRHSAMVCDV